jgi:lysophospholipase L1-like esterase
MALMLVLLPVAIGEVAARYAGYGGYPPVFRRLGEYAGKTYYATHQPGLSTFFFQNLTTVGSMEEQVFTMPKDAGTLRVVLVGESAMRGYPQPPSLAASSFFRAMLQEQLPDQRVEVLNFGTTAIASFAVMHILDEALAFDPDLVIVYCGNNEFYGAHGVASVHAFGRSTTAMSAFRFARRFAAVQWITDVQTRRSPNAEGSPRGQTLMEQIIGQAQIGPDDALRAAATANLERHLAHMVKSCNRRGVPVVVSTLPANERDLAPIGAQPPLPLELNAAAMWQEHMAAGRKLANSDAAASLAEFRKAEAIFGRSAALQYVIAQSLAALNRPEEAAAAYKLAREWDPMPWRSLPSMNDAIRRVAANCAMLCDLQAEFAAHSAGGVPDWSLMDDHVHPSLAGQALTARAWLRTLASEKLLGLNPDTPIDALGPAQIRPWEGYAARLGDNVYDRYGVAHRMLSLLSAPFYRANNEAALARFTKICADHEAAMSPSVLAAVQRWQQPSAHTQYHRPITSFVAQALMAEGNFTAADRLFLIAADNVPTYHLWGLEFTWNALQCRRRLRPAPLAEDLALAQRIVDRGEVFMAVTRVQPPPIVQYVGLAHHVLGHHAKAADCLGEVVKFVVNVEGMDVVAALADSLVKTGRREDARRLLSMPQSNPELAAACRDMLQALDAKAAP